VRVRALDADGDMQFGAGQVDYLVDSAKLVAQMVKTRLLLTAGEWFLDTAAGTPYSTDILGVGTRGRYDPALRERLIGTPGARNLVSYSSSLKDRKLVVNAALDTIFGDQAVVSEVIP
jgi:hypothetical protein